ncbi:contractile injection system protein, VgrG/Pvc8 family [Alteromonas sp. a30]|uniref:contractile injection system protein, VgrG/Pvc8 family n=1 Tax=Alteromonas sp. a30 TaxID=2730917 RepID=UPI00227F7B7A|nr:contractile injection system protein, VgrG/Pvc8 family [Alteromonas sp. a30]MCY7293842.1 hypothetical protein [Alteromonas sp. a30]
MKLETGHNTEQHLEKLDYLSQPKPKPVDFASAPRCSLDFSIELDDGTILDDSVLRIQQFSGHEALSQMYDLSVTLHANTFTSSGLDRPWGELIDGSYGALLKPSGKTTRSINFEELLGAKACIRMGLPETSEDVITGDYPEERPVVFFNGIITNFSMSQRGVYQASIKPALYKLSLQNNFRLFSQQTILDVVMQILSENNIDFNHTELEAKPNKIICGLATYRKQDWLQAGETDLAFLQRLMGKVNLFYYFKHSAYKHEMIISDQPYYQSIYQREVNTANGKFEETDKLKPLFLSFSKQQSADRDDYITQFNYQQNLTTSGIKTVLAQKEANWESQKTAQTTPVYLDMANSTEKLNMELLHVVQYGATEKEIEALTNTSMNKLTASRFSFSGASNCSEMKPGYMFLVKERDAADSDLNTTPIFPTLNNQEFVVTSVQHQASAEGDYSNQFQAVDARGLATPFENQTGNMGSILAQVVDNSAAKKAQANEQGQLETNRQQGASDKYLTKDVFSYDSKNFYFDADTQEAFKCKGIYVRFIDEPKTAAPHWVKLSEHMETIPEIESFVTIGRSTDDNEIPEVQQSLQAKGSKVIMPDDYTCHTSVGNNYNTSYGDNTSISFGADVSRPLSYAKNIVETQRNSGKYNGVSYSESSSYGYSVTPHSHNISRTGDGPDLPANPSDKMQYVSYGHQATHGKTYNKNEQFGDTSNYHNQVGHSHSESTQIGGSTSISSLDWSNSTSHVDQSTSINSVQRNSSISITGVNASLSSTSMSVGASVTGMSMNASITGMEMHSSFTTLSVGMSSTDLSFSVGSTGLSQSSNTVGASISESITGASVSSSLTGASSSSGLTGVNDSTDITGVSSRMSVTGSSSSLSVTGESTDISVTGSGLSVSVVGSGASVSEILRPDIKMKQLALDIVSSIKMVL